MSTGEIFPNPIPPVDLESLGDKIGLLIEKIEEVTTAMSSLENRLSSLENRFLPISEEELYSQADATVDDENVVEVSKEQAKEMILKLFEEKGELDYFDIITELDLDLKLVVEICAELEEEKRIEGID